MSTLTGQSIGASPGPWTRKRLDANHSMVHAADGTTVVPRMITEPGTASEASGDLIAAAPELLAALEEAANELWRIPIASTEILNKVRAALAKAGAK